MQMFSRALLVLACIAASAPMAWPQESQRNRILALENAWDRAVQQKDVKVVDLLMADELVYIDFDGRIMNKTQYLASIGEPQLRIEHVISGSMQVQFRGETAIVIGVYQEKGARRAKPFMRRERFVDTWIERNGLWLCVASQSTLILH
ncbi:MAG TPA: nuclear transport factor 2 family protein [Candidatus Aquilonibacter sp.]|nr:nuclear transport factor 2 family protein [Candidatus Aquilonibacter sp.]